MKPVTLFSGDDGHPSAIPSPDAPFAQAVQQALAHLHDPAFLQTHPLAAALAAPQSGETAAGQALQRRLLDAIEQLRPAPRTPPADRAWRSYRLLRLRYREGLDVPEVSRQLGIGRREFYRERRRALEAVASLLRPLHAASPSYAEAPAAAGRRPAAAPLTGRDDELAFLKAEYDAVAAGAGARMVLISGEPGVGKTRLAQELGRVIRQAGGAFLHGRFPREGGGPYLPWAEALRLGLQGLPPQELAQAAGPYAGDLAAILPEVAEAAGPPALPPAPDADERRLRLYDGVARLVERMAQRGPLALLLDDLQWATGMTLLAHVRQRAAAARVLFLGAYRPDEFAERPALVRARDDLYRARLFMPLALRPLTLAETVQMAAHTLGVEAAAQLGETLFRTARGNPFFIEEAVRALVESGAVRPGAAGWTASDVRLPETLGLVIEERVARLGEQVRETLQHAAVLGQQFSFAELQAMTGADPEMLAAQLERALTAGLLLDESTPAVERFAFADEQTVDMLYSSLSGIRRRRLHRRAGEALERVHAARRDAVLEQLARHFLEASAAEQAADYAFRAGRKAEDVYLWPRAFPFYQTALDLWERLGDHREQRAAVCERLGVVGPRVQADAAQVRDWLEQALALAEELGDRKRAAAVQTLISRHAASSGGGTAPEEGPVASCSA